MTLIGDIVKIHKNNKALKSNEIVCKRKPN